MTPKHRGAALSADHGIGLIDFADHLGPLGPECFSEGNVVYANRDHPLFQRESRKASAQTMYIARLVTQEISLMKETRSPRLAFSRQSQLLKDAFAEE